MRTAGAGGDKDPKNLVDVIDGSFTRQILTVLLPRQADNTVLFLGVQIPCYRKRN